VYAGQDKRVFETLENEAVPLARYSPRLSPDLLPDRFHRCLGCFLKLELALVPELAQDAYVLYCDVDVLFFRPIIELFGLAPKYMGMAREATAPFFHEYQALEYEFQGRKCFVPMPFPIWTFSSGVVLFNLQRLRHRSVVEHFLAFCRQNVDRIGNLDQSLLNYFFGKRISRLADRWNRPPYQSDCLDTAHIVHFHGPKPWEKTAFPDLRINCFETMRDVWFSYLREDEKKRFVL
jgi:lipopolysaccharide biosynthesis glycosyltransferase